MKRADYGEEVNYGFGFLNEQEALDTIDPDNADVGSTWKIAGEYFRLVEDDHNEELILRNVKEEEWAK